MTRWDKYLIITIVLLSLAAMFYMKNIATNQGEKYISIEVNGEEYKKVTFTNDNKKRYLEIKTKYGYNKLEIQNEKIKVIEADCPDKLDVKQGFIEETGSMIVCLPNRLVIEIKGKQLYKNNIDAGSY